MPLDPDCKDVIAFKAVLLGNPVTGTCHAPNDDDMQTHFVRLQHRTGCPRCREYGHANAIVTEVAA